MNKPSRITIKVIFGINASVPSVQSFAKVCGDKNKTKYPPYKYFLLTTERETKVCWW